jgi:uncharacterized protein
MKPSALAFVAALALTGPLAAAPASAQTASADAVFAATTLNLGAYGETKVAPDMATINFAVVTEAATAQEAMRENARRMSEVMAALRRSGIAERDVQTSGLNLNPQYRYEENQPPRLTGYQATNQVTVTVNDLARLGPSVDAVVGAGVNQIGGVGFGLKDPAAAENAARQAAVRALQAKAYLYAGAVNLKVKRLVSLTEGTSFTAPPPMPMARMAAMEMAADAKTSVSPGELRVRVDVSGTYELER